MSRIEWIIMWFKVSIYFWCIQFLGVLVQYGSMVSGTHRYKFQFQFEECNCWQLLLCWSANPIFVAFYYFLLALSLILLTLNRSFGFWCASGTLPHVRVFYFHSCMRRHYCLPLNKRQFQTCAAFCSKKQWRHHSFLPT